MSDQPGRRTPLLEHVYRALLRLYPETVRAEDGRAMEELFSDLCEAERRRRGWLGVLVISIRSFAEVPMRALLARAELRRGSAPRRTSAGGGGPLGWFVQDLRFGLRSLRRTPVVGMVTILSLGLGVGAVTTACSLAAGTIFRRPVGLSDPQGLVTIYTSREDGEPYGNTSFPDFQSIVEEIDGLEGGAAFGLRGFAMGEGLTSASILAEEVSRDYFAVTGIRPVLGRGFLPGEVYPGPAERVVILGHHVWMEHFGGSSEVLGRAVRLNGQPFTVVGIGPKGVMSRRLPVLTDAWVPIGVPGTRSTRRAEALLERGTRPYLLLGRMKEGVRIGQIQTQLSVLAGRLHREYAEVWTDDRGQARAFTPLSEKDSRLNPRARPLLAGIALFFLVATGFILLIACSNVATLFLARAGRRRREMAIRISVGASRPRLLGQLLTEGLILGLPSGAVGVLIALFTVRQVKTFSLPLNVPFNPAVSLDHRVLIFAILASIGATLLFALFPALEASRPDLMPPLKGEGGGFLAGPKGRTSRRTRGRNQLVVVQCAASLVLIVGAALFIRTLQKATAMDLGFSTQGVAVMTRSLPESEYTPAEGIEVLRALRGRLSALPGVVSAQLSRSLELTLFQAGAEATVFGEGSWTEEGEGQRVLRNSVTPGYLEMLEIPLLRGRTLQESDVPGSPLVAVVNETFAERFWPGQDPVGRRFRMTDMDGWHGETGTDPIWMTVVGMVKNGTYEDFDDGLIPFFWTSLFQDYASTVAVSLKGIGEGEEMVPLLRDHVELAPGEVPLVYPSTLDGQVSIQFIHLRIASDLLGWGGAFGLILAAVGLYGIVTMAVTDRTREMAIRLALGADRGEVIRRVSRGGTNLALVGLLVGLLIGLPLAHLLRSVFHGVGPLDPLALGGGIGILALTALVASLVPARRVTRIHPMTVLRED